MQTKIDLLTPTVGFPSRTGSVLRPTLIIGQKSELATSSDNQKNDSQVLDIAKGVLAAEWSEITQYERISNPKIDYTRREGYPILL